MNTTKQQSKHRLSRQQILIRTGLFLLVFILLSRCAGPVWERVDLKRRTGDPVAAERELLAHIKLHPSDAKALFLLGETRAQMENWQGMIEAFDECERFNIDWRWEIFGRKNHYWRRNFEDGLHALKSRSLLRARNLFEACTIIFSTRGRGFRLFAETSLALGDTSAAIDAFVYTLRIDDEDERARRFLMTTYFYTGQYNEAIHHADYILGRKKNDLEALRVKAYSLGLQKKRTEANQAYMQLISLPNQHIVTDLTNFAGYKYSMGLYADAARLLRQAMDYGAEKKETLEAILQTRLMQQNYVDLMRDAEDLLAVDSTSIKGLQLKQIAQLAMRKQDEATSTELAYLITMSTLRLAMKDYGEVIKNTNEVLRQDSLHIKAYELKIAALDSSDKKIEARKNEMEMLHILTDKAVEKNDYEKVIKFTSRILEINPIDLNAMNHKDKAHIALGNIKAADRTRIKYYFALADMHAQKKDYSSRLQDANYILNIESDNLDALKIKWDAEVALGNTGEALKSELAYLNALAEFQTKKKAFTKVIETTTRIIEMDSTNARSNVLKRDAHLALNQRKEAVQTELRHFETIANRLRQQEKYAELLAKVDDILMLQPENLHALELRIIAYEGLKQPARVKAAKMNYLLEKARRQSPAREFDALLATAEELLELEPRNTFGLQFRYLALRNLGRAEEAKKGEQVYLHVLAENYDQRQEWRKLQTTASALLKFNAVDSVAANFKIKSHEKLGQPEQARQTRLDYLEALCGRYAVGKRWDEIIAVTQHMLQITDDYLPALRLRKNAFYSKGEWEIGSQLENQIKELMTSKR